MSVSAVERLPTLNGGAGLAVVVVSVGGTRLLTVAGSKRPAGHAGLVQVRVGVVTLASGTHSGLHGRIVTMASHDAEGWLVVEV